MNKLNRQLTVLLRDYGYRFADNTLIEKGIRGFTSDRVIPYRFDSLFAASEYLIPIIRDDEYHSRFTHITKGN